MSLLLLFRRWRTAVTAVRRFTLSASAATLRPMESVCVKFTQICVKVTQASVVVTTADQTAHLGVTVTPTALLSTGAGHV